MFKKVTGLFSLLMALMVSTSFAALSPTDLTAIQTGIADADVNFYAIGGSILVVLAGIWGFKMVKRLIA